MTACRRNAFNAVMRSFQWTFGYSLCSVSKLALEITFVMLPRVSALLYFQPSPCNAKDAAWSAGILDHPYLRSPGIK